MAGSQGPQTFAKRQRERAKQMERQRKFAEKLERNAKKREAKRARDAGEIVPEDVALDPTTVAFDQNGAPAPSTKPQNAVPTSAGEALRKP